MGNKSGHPGEVWDIPPLLSEMAKATLLLRPNTVNKHPPRLKSIISIFCTSVGEVSVLGWCRSEATPLLSLISDVSSLVRFDGCLKGSR